MNVISFTKLYRCIWLHGFLLMAMLLLQACSETSTNKAAEDVASKDELVVDNEPLDPPNETPPTDPPVDPPADPPVTTVLCDSNAPEPVFIPVTALAATTAADFGSGANAIITGDSNGQFSSMNNINPTGSDITVATYGEFFYRIGRFFDGNNISKYAINDPQTVIWQYSVNDSSNDPVPANPYDIIFVSETKAYVLRYGKNKVWIVNPSASTEADFKIGELDLSAYGPLDGTPEMSAAIIVDKNLYIVMQRLEGASFDVVNDAYIAIFDTTTDAEIDANIAGDSLKGIPLIVRNPNNINYQAETNTLFVQASGSFFPVKYVGGIETVNLSTYASTLFLDDGDDVSHPYGLITALAVISPELLYFVGYQSFTDNTLYAVDINKRTISSAKVGQLISGQIQSLAVDPQGLLWVSDNANATVRILNPLSCEEIDAVSTNLNPAKIVFAQ
ncbi:hypothetical protein MNBD_GAMMA06-958 [hydrothermal vent metagenome]|uniref:Uncharacterized protein n=1 Tax=hydrothermal vent metagenome TaxID=652676 RepID=A0A3B0X631_9ZZZZ